MTGETKPNGENDQEWLSIDSRIKSWFYSTCDEILLQIITEDKCPSKDLCDELNKFFLNNKRLACYNSKKPFVILKWVHFLLLNTVINLKILLMI